MNLNKRILKAINEGVSAALMLDDAGESAIIGKSSEYISSDIKYNTEKALYSRILQESLPDPMDVDEEFIDQALKLYDLYGALYNPHLDEKEFRRFILKCIYIQGVKANLNWIDTSSVTFMAYMFLNSQFNGDISLWDVSNVENMGNVFENSQFNGDISLWDVSNVTDMDCMFLNSQFNGDISLWDVSNVEDMSLMFCGAKFSGDISSWDISNVKYMFKMFENSEFNNDISNWNVSNVTDMDCMFDRCPIPEENKPNFNI